MIYQEMASVYDTLMENVPYDKWHTWTEMLFKKAPLPVNSVMDLGCGTGQITRRLAASGYEAVGIDFSEDMLAYAKIQSDEAQLPIRWLQQDISRLEGLTSFDAAVSYLDVMNYITTERELKNTFSRIYDSLKQDGVFLFDVHALAHVEKRLVEQTFADVTDDIAYIWFCTKGENEGEMYHDMTFFIRNENDTFDKFSETHHQRTFPVHTYVNLLKEAGFKNCNIYADFSLNEHFSEEQAERIFFFAIK